TFVPDRSSRRFPASPLREQQVHDEAAADVDAARPAAVARQGGVGPGVFEGVGQHREADRVQGAAGQVAFVVDRGGQVGDGAASPAEDGGVEGGGAEGVADDVAEQVALRPALFLPGCADGVVGNGHGNPPTVFGKVVIKAL